MISNDTSSHNSTFIHKSAIPPSDLKASIASHCLREYFGPTVQLVADALHSRGDSSTFRQLILFLKRKLPNHTTRIGTLQTKLDQAPIRAALIVLIQHSIVKVIQPDDDHEEEEVKYKYQPRYARFLMRYPIFIDLVQRYLGPTEAIVYETVIVGGRESSAFLIEEVAQRLRDDENVDISSIVEALDALTKKGFLQLQQPLNESQTKAERNREDSARSKAVRDILKRKYSHLAPDAMWKADFDFAIDMLRAEYIGDFVSDICGSKIDIAKHAVTAGLRAVAFRDIGKQRLPNVDDEFSDTEERETPFEIDDLLEYLSKGEMEEIGKTGEVSVDRLDRTFKSLIRHRNPEIALGFSKDKIQIELRGLLREAQLRICHKVLVDCYGGTFDRVGQTHARILRILLAQGWLEADAVAKFAMVPVSEARAMLHTLYRDGYLEFFPMSTSRQHNPASTIYLWGVRFERLVTKVEDNVAKALYNMRLRRQHEYEAGKHFIDRAHEASTMDENESEIDKQNSKNFALGLERLDLALLHLDRTHAVLSDFSFKSF